MIVRLHPRTPEVERLIEAFVTQTAILWPALGRTRYYVGNVTHHLPEYIEFELARVDGQVVKWA